ncbi:hypothetical protein WHI96_27070 [Pseudonocardia tropica]|uniref:Uncharacterized protein n=1 Tax=Pseudonocardia tropica TaxID=681289 RepID=A0ABV1K539_9PSEU
MTDLDTPLDGAPFTSRSLGHLLLAERAYAAGDSDGACEHRADAAGLRTEIARCEALVSVAGR